MTRAIKSLGFAVIASKEDVDKVFELFDLDGSGAISLKEMTTMLRQRADQER